MPSLVPPERPEPQRALAREFLKRGGQHFREKDYYEAVRNLKIARYLDHTSEEIDKRLEEAQSALSKLRHEMLMEKANPGIGCVPRTSPLEDIAMEMEVGRTLMNLEMYRHAKVAFFRGLEIVMFYRHAFKDMALYEQRLKSAIEKCDRKLHPPAGAQ